MTKGNTLGFPLHQGPGGLVGTVAVALGEGQYPFAARGADLSLVLVVQNQRDGTRRNARDPGQLCDCDRHPGVSER